MTMQQFETALKTVCPETYPLAAPPGSRRCVKYHSYGANHQYGDDHNVLDLPRVQLDILIDRADDPLPEDVAALLQSLYLPYTEISRGYDPEYNCIRVIYQLEVV